MGVIRKACDILVAISERKIYSGDQSVDGVELKLFLEKYGVMML